jgi:small acid-soluble spore protein E (minor gamma-type SASP)
MANNQQRNKTATGANVQKAKQQNAAANQFGTEFASETDVQAAAKKNQKAEQ